MPFKRKIDESYPVVYNTWKIDDATIVIQDLVPEDDEEALKILKEHMITDEVLCGIQKLKDDPLSVHEMLEFWRECLKERMSLGCYEVKNGQKKLVALNVCIVGCEGEDHYIEFKGQAWKNVYDVVIYAEKQVDAYKYIGSPTVLHAMGLIVKRENRGQRLGQKILDAREPLCRSQGLKGTATCFTGIGSQISAERCNFQTIAQFSIKELGEKGFPFPKDDERLIKYMAKKYDF